MVTRGSGVSGVVKFCLWTEISHVESWGRRQQFNWKNGERRTEKSSKINRLSPFFFAWLLLCNERERAAAEAGRKSVCDKRYHGSGVRPKYNDFIKKIVSVRTVKSWRGNGFSPFFWRLPYGVMIACEWLRRWRKICLGARYIRGEVRWRFAHHG